MWRRNAGRGAEVTDSRDRNGLVKRAPKRKACGVNAGDGIAQLWQGVGMFSRFAELVIVPSLLFS